MAISKVLTVADCQNIQKAFERGSAYAATEESVFVLMAPLLTNMRIQSSAFIAQAESAEAVTSPLSSKRKAKLETEIPFISSQEEQDLNVKNMDKSDESDEAISSKILPNSPSVEGTGKAIDASLLGGVFNSECIPCGLRLNMLGELNTKAFAEYGKNYLDHWKTWLAAQLKQIMDMINLFNGNDRYIDLCALIKFLTDFMCVPDLQRILSVLMALMSKVSFDIGGVLDLIMSLVAPLLQPFLSGLVDMIGQYIMMIVKPIECIINSLQNIIRKLDYNVLFQNIGSLEKHVSLGPKTGQKQPDPRGPIKVPFLGLEIPRTDVAKGDKRAFEADFNLAGPIASGIKHENAKNQSAVEKAHKELQALQVAHVDGANSNEVERHRKQVEKAKQKYKDAQEERDLSELGQVNASIGRTTQSMRSSIYSLIGFLKEAAQSVEAFFANLFDELRKIMGEFIGGGGSMIELMFSKLQLIQTISLISSIISAITSGLECDDEEDIRVERFITPVQGMKVWTDESGDLHIQEDNIEIDKAIEETVQAIGVTPDGTSTDTVKQNDKDATIESRQKLKSLIEFTGDPVLDVDIARATDALTTPVNVTFKCPLQTTVDQAEQINKWMKELDTE